MTAEPVEVKIPASTFLHFEALAMLQGGSVERLIDAALLAAIDGLPDETRAQVLHIVSAVHRYRQRKGIE